ncbi:MAG: hypothetical protein NWF00_01070 [Candidatus Bathyarchaeota archaeon]|nr:hypothetical protein [Candidatus Bathyarchaeota archaeon]
MAKYMVAPKASTIIKGEQVVRLSTTKETYIETIDTLTKRRGYAAVTDIAKELGVRPSTVSSMLQNLDAIEFVKYTPYRNALLTRKGKSLASFLEQSQKYLKSMFKLLGVNEDVAQEDAYAIEHIIHVSTLEKLSRFVEFLQNTSQGAILRECFKNHEQLKESPPKVPLHERKMPQ